LFAGQAYAQANYCANYETVQIRKDGQVLDSQSMPFQCMYGYWSPHYFGLLSPGTGMLELSADHSYYIYYGDESIPLQAHVSATWNVLDQPSDSYDQKPPAFTFLRWYSDSNVSDFFDQTPGAQNYFRFALDATGGQIQDVQAVQVTPNGNQALQALPDSIFGHDNGYRVNLPGILPDDWSCASDTVTFQITATKVPPSGGSPNTLTYRFQVPKRCSRYCATSGDCPAGGVCSTANYCQGAAPVQTFEVYNPNGQKVAGFSSTGRIIIKGSCQQAAPCFVSNPAFEVRNPENMTVTQIDQAGNLCLAAGGCENTSDNCSNADLGQIGFSVTNGNNTTVSYITHGGSLCKSQLIQNGQP
jgi:hypothetical protein